MTISLFDTATPLAPLRAAIDARIASVLDRGAFVLGPEVEAFEREFAAYLGVRHAIGVANGTDAITIALRALGVKPGDEVVVPSFTFYATAEAVVTAGATPVFCDVDIDTRNVTVDTVRAVLTPACKAIVSVDLFGCPAPELRGEFGLPVLEDAAQAAGAGSHAGRPGTLGVAATFSFYPSKNLPCLGDGGAIVTNEAVIAERARVLRFHGSRDKADYEEVGYNSRLDELQAAVLRVQLPYLDRWADGRRAADQRYYEAGIARVARPPERAPGAVPAWHLYVIAHRKPDRVASALAQAEIGCRPYYRTPVHRQAPMRQWASHAQLPGTEQAAREHLAIPMSPFLTPAQAQDVVAAIRRV
jgi:dTDP-3-amino-3,4,6-trideoxy-alpha-D-glucose transaminase